MLSAPDLRSIEARPGVPDGRGIPFEWRAWHPGINSDRAVRPPEVVHPKATRIVATPVTGFSRPTPLVRSGTTGARAVVEARPSVVEEGIVDLRDHALTDPIAVRAEVRPSRSGRLHLSVRTCVTCW